MQLDGFGETERFAGQALDAGTQRQMLAFHLLRTAFSRHMGFRSQMPRICPPMIGEERCDAKGVTIASG
jgi:hypothetical protein